MQTPYSLTVPKAFVTCQQAMRLEIHSLALLLLLAEQNTSTTPGAKARFILPASFSTEGVNEIPTKAIGAVGNSRSGGKYSIFLDAATDLPRLATTALSGAPSRAALIAHPRYSCPTSSFDLKIICVLQGWMQGCRNSALNDNVNSRPLEYIVCPLFPPPAFARKSLQLCKHKHLDMILEPALMVKYGWA